MSEPLTVPPTVTAPDAKLICNLSTVISTETVLVSAMFLCFVMLNGGNLNLTRLTLG